MTQYNTVNLKLSNWQLNELKSGMKNNTEAALKNSSNVVGHSNNENNFLHKLLLTNRQLPNFRKAFANNSSANIKLSKTQMQIIGQPGGFLDRLLEPLLRTGLRLLGNVLKSLIKSILIPPGSTAATDAAIH